ncbi:MAG: Ig-like domain-containing protein, partial [Planctomycetota bacterium]
MKTRAWLTIIVMVLFMGYVMSFNYGGCGSKSKSHSGSSGAAVDTTPPIVSAINPVNLATGVFTNSKITATFSEALTDEGTFTLAQGTTPVTGTVTYDAVGFTLTFAPASNLASSTVYTATLTTGTYNYVWSFTTGAAADTTPPTVSLVTPLNLATGVLINKKIAATFSEAMDPATITA